MNKKLLKSLSLMLVLTAGLSAGTAYAQAPTTPPAPQPRLDWQKSGYNVGFPAPADKRITRDNALAYPYTGWSYQHVRELFPTRGVARGGQVSPLPSQPVSLDGLTFVAPDGKTINWSQFEAETHTDAMLVLHKGKIVYERYANGM
ncbi:MAG: 6-aminohexanoate hydrolase, partial [Hyphomonadaceae bacterium]